MLYIQFINVQVKRGTIMPERVWDPYLTPQDRAHLAVAPHQSVGFGEKPALLLVDLYRWVYGDDPQPLLESIEDWPGSCGLAAWDAVPHIQTLLEASRKAGDTGGARNRVGRRRH